ncbi:hypothetical protein M9H77_09342 [Catharanthus roseus]|uniref:Uncharacterized protein n=1 Tax=Catharanthus roseus TaxID=4058 RepID=A0ACC0C0I8_CATRO|nr:hypothetical protein M9H77_09342 [Catharanthus roseus]
MHLDDSFRYQRSWRRRRMLDFQETKKKQILRRKGKEKRFIFGVLLPDLCELATANNDKLGIDSGKTFRQFSSVTTTTDSWLLVIPIPDALTDGILLFRGMSAADASPPSVTYTDRLSDGYCTPSLMYVGEVTDCYFRW